MNIKVRKIDIYKEFTLKAGQTTFESGLLDGDEQHTLAQTLISAAVDFVGEEIVYDILRSN